MKSEMRIRDCVADVLCTLQLTRMRHKEDCLGAFLYAVMASWTEVARVYIASRSIRKDGHRK